MRFVLGGLQLKCLCPKTTKNDADAQKRQRALALDTRNRSRWLTPRACAIS